MPRRVMPGRGVSGNPARRAVREAIVEAQRLWPFAFDYYLERDRIALFADVGVVQDENGLSLDVPGVGLIPVNESLPDDADSLALVAIVNGADGEIRMLVGNGDNFDQVVDRMLYDLTLMFTAEMDSDLHRVTRDQLSRKPDLAKEELCLELLLGLIVRPGDLELVQD